MSEESVEFMDEENVIENERSLTKAEQKRKEVFLQTCEQLEAEGYSARAITISIPEANKQAMLLTVPPVIALLVVFFLLHPLDLDHLSIGAAFVMPAAVLVAFFVLIFAHEGIHGLVWGACAPDHFKSISFGVIWEMLTPYCTCSQPLSRAAYFVGALAPTVVLGIVPCLIALFTGSFFLMAVGCLMIIGGGGDIAIIRQLIKAHISDSHALYLDHPCDCGSVVFEKLNLQV